MRRYWQPAALSEELPPGGAPLPVRLLGEDLVLFRDDQGRPGLLGLHCSHRGADLSYGRIEDGGLRCLYHGWLYDIGGRCLEQPGEPSNSWTYLGSRDSMQSSTLEAQSGARGRPFHERTRHTAYPCREAGGAIFAYLGPGEPPLLPSYGFLTVPDDHEYAVKLFSDCNYLQDRASMLADSYSGIDPSFFQQQDLCATEGAGPIQDRCPEHLTPSDAPLAVARNLLRSAIKQVEEGRDPPPIARDEDANDFPTIVATSGTLPSGVGWKEHCDRLAATGRGW